MRKWMIGVALASLMAGAGFAQENEIQGVIGSQIEAFKVDDFAEAFEFAAPNIQSIFRTPQNFGRMVTQGYPMVWRPAEVTFLELREQNGRYLQRVQIVDAEGGVHLLDYGMTQTPEGWKINGVQLLESAGVNA